MAEEVREVCDVGDGDVSAGSLSDAHPNIEVKDEIASIEQVKSASRGWYVLQLGDNSSGLSRVRDLGRGLQDSAQHKRR
jgi:hypothetical protein